MGRPPMKDLWKGEGKGRGRCSWLWVCSSLSRWNGEGKKESWLKERSGWKGAELGSEQGGAEEEELEVKQRFKGLSASGLSSRESSRSWSSLS